MVSKRVVGIIKLWVNIGLVSKISTVYSFWNCNLKENDCSICFLTQNRITNIIIKLSKKNLPNTKSIALIGG